MDFPLHEGRARDDDGVNGNGTEYWDLRNCPVSHFYLTFSTSFNISMFFMILGPMHPKSAALQSRNPTREKGSMRTIFNHVGQCT